MNEPLIQELFVECLDLPPRDRAAFIERSCEGNAGLAADLRGLLAAHDEAESRPDFLAGFDPAVASRLVGEAAPGSPSFRLQEGDELGPYRIEGKLGQGGMGVVHLASDTRLGRRVALKLVPPHLQANRAARRRLSDEARAASALDHPNIATIYDIVDPEEGPAFIAMAYCEGPTLKELLVDGPLPEDEAFAIVRQVAEGLGAAHQQGIIHRDVKPANIIVAPDGRARIVDFGIARLMGSGEPPERATPGTIAYMSPEQTRSDGIDHRSDLWSLGVMLHEMLTGRRPFDADDDAAVIRAIRNDPAPPDAVRAVRRALEKDPAHRCASAAEFLAALPAAGNAGRRRGRRSAVRWIAGGVVVAGGLLYALMGPPGTGGTDAGASAAPSVRRLAVLPLEHRGPDTAAYVAQGLGDELTARLSTLDGVRVIGRRSAGTFGEAELTPKRIADSLGVDLVLDGDVLWEGEQARLTLRLVDAASGDDRWSGRYDVTAESSFAMEARIGRDVVDALALRLSDAEAARLSERGTGEPEAYRAYRRGRYYWNRRDHEGLLRAKEEFERSIDIDPAYADAWAGLSDVYLLQASRGILPAAEANPLARQSAENAIALEPDHAGALMVLGSIQLQWYHDWRGAEESFHRALAADPEYAPAHYWYSEFLGYTGRTDEAIEHARIAQELEPLMLLGHADEARALYLAGRFDEAIEQFEAVLERGWSFVAFLYTPLAHSQAGNHEAAIGTMGRFIEAAPSAYERYLAGYVYARAGRRAQADSVLAEALAVPAGEIPAIIIATIYVGRGEHDEAIGWFERALENREWQAIFLPQEPLFDPVREDPRFQELLLRVGP